MLYPLAHSALGFRRRWLLGLTVVVAASFAGKDGFAVETKSVLDQSTKAASKEDKGAADQAKGSDKAGEIAVKSDAKSGSTDGAAVQEKGKGEDDIDFTSNAPIDPIPALGEGIDDFQDLDKRAAQYAKEGAVESEDARVERELKAYKEAEAKAEREKSEQEAKAREAARASAREEAEKAAHTNKKIESEAEKKARELQGISNDELNWKGLED